MAKMLLIGRLGKDPEVRYTKSNKEYVSCVLHSYQRGTLLTRMRYAGRYSIATQNNTIGLPEGAQPTTTWHNVFSFNPSANNFLRNLKRGSLVYAEANFELRQPDPSADPDSPEGQRQIFLRHGASFFAREWLVKVSCLDREYSRSPPATKIFRGVRS